MRKYKTLKLFCISALLATTGYAQPAVTVAGAMSNIMKKGDLSAHLRLDTLDKTRLYGLGPVAGLKGELMILDGRVYSSHKTGDEVENDTGKANAAAMLVYSRVGKWNEHEISKHIGSYEALEEAIEHAARKAGIDMSKPFAFRLKGTATAGYHIIDWEDGTAHTMENHKQFIYDDSIQDEAVEILGFYSDKHHGVFTHHSTNMHIHILTGNNTVGHVDKIHSLQNMRLLLPAN